MARYRVLLLIAAATVLLSVAESAASESPLGRFEPFLDKTWVALVDPESGAEDVARWQWALKGRAIRIVHSVADGAYGGETFVVWDHESQLLRYTYFTTAGFTTRGTMRFDDDGVLHAHEEVAGHSDGVREVRSTQWLDAEGRLVVQTEMLRDGSWEDRGTVRYREQPDAELVLPERAEDEGD